jgi:hypothetical protein
MILPVKIPRWLANFSGKKTDVSKWLPVYRYHGSNKRLCHGYTMRWLQITRKQIINGLNGSGCGIPVTNYGMAIAYLHGIMSGPLPLL